MGSSPSSLTQPGHEEARVTHRSCTASSLQRSAKTRASRRVENVVGKSADRVGAQWKLRCASERVALPRFEAPQSASASWVDA